MQMVRFAGEGGKSCHFEAAWDQAGVRQGGGAQAHFVCVPCASAGVGCCGMVQEGRRAEANRLRVSVQSALQSAGIGQFGGRGWGGGGRFLRCGYSKGLPFRDGNTSDGSVQAGRYFGGSRGGWPLDVLNAPKESSELFLVSGGQMAPLGLSCRSCLPSSMSRLGALLR